MEDKFNLKRFVSIQSNQYEIALNEIKNGSKKSHWMWYIFPQYRGLGRTKTSVKYSIKSKNEAIKYFKDPLLGTRLKEITREFLLLENKTAFEVLSSPDYLKMKSSMTLFDIIQSETDLFNSVLDKYYEGKRCLHTVSELRKES